MSEITIIYILLAMAFLCIIWLLLERDRMHKEQIVMNMIYHDILDILDAKSKEIGEILAKLENLTEQEK